MSLWYIICKDTKTGHRISLLVFRLCSIMISVDRRFATLSWWVSWGLLIEGSGLSCVFSDECVEWRRRSWERRGKRWQNGGWC